MMPMVESMIVTPVSRAHAVSAARRGARAAGAAGGPPGAARVASFRARRRIGENRQGRRGRRRAEAAGDGDCRRSGDRAVRRHGAGDGARACSTSRRRRSMRASRRARSEHDRAIKFWQQAVAAADQLPYDEPPVWFYPVRESLGAALLAAGRAADAERVFQRGSRQAPAQCPLAVRPAAALAKQGKEADAAWVQREFERGVEERGHEADAGRFLRSTATAQRRNDWSSSQSRLASGPILSQFLHELQERRILTNSPEIGITFIQRIAGNPSAAARRNHFMASRELFMTAYVEPMMYAV